MLSPRFSAQTVGQDLHEGNDGDDLDGGEYEFCLTITLYSKQVDEGDEDEEYADKHDFGKRNGPVPQR